MVLIPTAKEAKKVSVYSNENGRIKRAAFEVVDNLQEEISNNIMKAAKSGLYKTNFRIYYIKDLSIQAKKENINVNALAETIIANIDKILVKLGYKVIHIKFPDPKFGEFGYRYKIFDYLDISVSWEDEKENE